MPYHVSLTTFAGEQRYRVLVVDELDRSTARHLGDWLEAAKLNPGARFEIDLSEARWVDERALGRLIRRHGDVRLEGRLEVLGRRRAAASHLAFVPPAALVVAESLLTAW
jgi:hypothetical protein